MSKGPSLFTLVSGLAFGAAAGLIAGLVIGPKLDETTKKEIERVATDLYGKARVQLEEKLETLRIVGSKIDQEKYRKLVEEVVANLRSSGEVTAQSAIKLGKELKEDWDKADKSTIKATKPVKVVKSAKKVISSKA